MALQVLDIVAGVTGIISFGKDFLTPPPKTSVNGGDSHVRITVALNDHPGESADGDAPFVLAYDDMYHLVGTNLDGHHIPNGGFSDLTIDQSAINGGEPGAQPTYLQLQARNKAVCVATIGQTWANGDTRGWIGDWGQICGWPWYYSNIHVGDHVPSCTWLDGDNTPPGNKAAGLQIYMQNFTDKNVHKKDVNKDVYCRWPLQYYVDNNNDALVGQTPTLSNLNNGRHHFWTNGVDALWQALHCALKQPGCIHFSNTPHNKRSLEETLDAADPALVAEMLAAFDKPDTANTTTTSTKRSRLSTTTTTTAKLNTRNTANRVITSTNGQHSASDLCASDSSSGPDFVSYAENLYCDMDLKKTFPLCAEETQMGCYDVEGLKLRDGGALQRRDGGEGGEKVHDSLVEWK